MRYDAKSTFHWESSRVIGASNRNGNKIKSSCALIASDANAYRNHKSLRISLCSPADSKRRFVAQTQSPAVAAASKSIFRVQRSLPNP